MAQRSLRRAEAELEQASTEQVLESARHLDRLSVGEMLELIHREDGEAWKAVGAELCHVAEAVEILSEVVGAGGRWFNVGAGTSGRLGVLDASEIPPTFGMPHIAVQGVIAGGEAALRSAVEGAEDDGAAAHRELRERRLSSEDAVVAISASGVTPFALGGIEAAHEVGARSIAITCVAGSPMAERAELAIVPRTGPEVVTGSTRMKAGLAQKMVLHMLSTAVMVKLGRVEGNLMTRIAPVSAKLRGRSLRILMTLSGLGPEDARALLDRHEGQLAPALAEARACQARGADKTSDR